MRRGTTSWEWFTGFPKKIIIRRKSELVFFAPSLWQLFSFLCFDLDVCCWIVVTVRYQCRSEPESGLCEVVYGLLIVLNIGLHDDSPFLWMTISARRERQIPFSFARLGRTWGHNSRGECVEIDTPLETEAEICWSRARTGAAVFEHGRYPVAVWRSHRDDGRAAVAQTTFYSFR